MLKQRRPFLAEINVTPFVDVMLVLLVIFMITAPLMQQGMEVQLPKESIAPISVKEIPTITLKSSKKIFWKKEELTNLMGLTGKVEQYMGLIRVPYHLGYPVGGAQVAGAEAAAAS